MFFVLFDFFVYFVFLYTNKTPTEYQQSINRAFISLFIYLYNYLFVYCFIVLLFLRYIVSLYTNKTPTEYQQSINRVPTEYKQQRRPSRPGRRRSGQRRPGRPSPPRRWPGQLVRRCCWYSVGTLLVLWYSAGIYFGIMLVFCWY